MSRARRFFTTIVPAMLAGGLLFGGGFGYAAVGDRGASFVPGGADGAGSAGARADAPRRASGKRTAQSPPPAPPMPPVPPASPTPPSSGTSGSGRGFSVRVQGGKVQIDGLESLVRNQLDAVRDMIRNNPQIPADVRAKVLSRLDRTRGKLDRRLRNMSGSDIDAIENEMEKLGEELERSMEGLEEELSKLGEKLGKDIAKSIQKDWAKSFGKDFPGHQDDDDSDASDHSTPDVDVNVNVNVPDDLRGITLKQSQREQIAKLRAKSEREIAEATKQLDNATRRLEQALADPNVNDTQISNYVDDVSRFEARIRKARLLTWVNARRVLDDSQRRKIEAAAKRPH